MSVSTHTQDQLDHWLEIDGVKCAGQHILIDMHGVAFDKLNDCDAVGAALKIAALEAGATVLHSYMHPFQPQGVSGAVILSESHISIHTWPERGFAAIDVFMCGAADPKIAVLHLAQHFLPTAWSVETVLRGSGA